MIDTLIGESLGVKMYFLLHALMLMQVYFYKHTEGRETALTCNLRTNCAKRGLNNYQSLSALSTASRDFLCEVPPAGVNVTWWRSSSGRNNSDIQIFPSNEVGSSLFLTSRNILQISTATAELEGFYSCVVITTSGDERPPTPLGCLLVVALGVFAACPDQLDGCSEMIIPMQTGGTAILDVRVTFVRGGGCANQGVRFITVERDGKDEYICSNLFNPLAPCGNNTLFPKFTVIDAGNCTEDCKYNILLQLDYYNESDAGLYIVIVSFDSDVGTRREIRRDFRLEHHGSITRLQLSPGSFMGTTSIRPEGNCVLRKLILDCIGETILNDNDLGPSQPDLSNPNHRSQFAVWNENNENPHISFLADFESVAAVDIYLLHWPEAEFGVPNFNLYDLSESKSEPVMFDLLNNHDLSQSDRSFSKVTIRPRTRITGRTYRLDWTFTNLYRVNHFGVSEIILRENRVTYAPWLVMFNIPAMDGTILEPSAEDIRSGSLTLFCSVSSEGLFLWRWSKNGAPLQNSGFIITSYGDGTRTSVLVINSFGFDDNGTYSCEADFDFPGTVSESRSYIVQFPLKTQIQLINTEESAILLCDVFGYASNITKPKWLSPNGEILGVNTFRVTYGASNNTLIYPNGTTGFGIVSTLTIDRTSNPLDVSDGIYTCEAGEARSSIQLMIRMTTEPDQLTYNPSGSSSLIRAGSSSLIGAGSSSLIGAVAGAVISLGIIAVLVPTEVLLFKRFHRKDNTKESSKKEKNGEERLRESEKSGGGGGKGSGEGGRFMHQNSRSPSPSPLPPPTPLLPLREKRRDKK